MCLAYSSPEESSIFSQLWGARLQEHTEDSCSQSELETARASRQGTERTQERHREEGGGSCAPHHLPQTAPLLLPASESRGDGSVSAERDREITAQRERPALRGSHPSSPQTFNPPPPSYKH